MVSRHRLFLAVALCCFAVTFVIAQDAPGSGADQSNLNGTDAQLLASQYRSRHVFVVMEENRSIGVASEYMPYLKSLAVQYSQGMQVYSDSHGSWLAYGELTSGSAPLGGEAVGQICSAAGCSPTTS